MAGDGLYCECYQEVAAIWTRMPLPSSILHHGNTPCTAHRPKIHLPQPCLESGVRNPLVTRALVDMLADRIGYGSALLQVFGTLPLFLLTETVAALGGPPAAPGSRNASGRRSIQFSPACRRLGPIGVRSNGAHASLRKPSAKRRIAGRAEHLSPLPWAQLTIVMVKETDTRSRSNAARV